MTKQHLHQNENIHTIRSHHNQNIGLLWSVDGMAAKTKQCIFLFNVQYFLMRASMLGFTRTCFKGIIKVSINSVYERNSLAKIYFGFVIVLTLLPKVFPMGLALLVKRGAVAKQSWGRSRSCFVYCCYLSREPVRVLFSIDVILCYVLGLI